MAKTDEQKKEDASERARTRPPAQGGHAASDMDSPAAGGTGDSSAASDAADDAALAKGDHLDKGKPPTVKERLAAAEQAAKDFGTKAQEAADAAIRQGSSDANASFQPPEGMKPAYVRGGLLVSPDGKRATEKNLALDEEDSDQSVMYVPPVQANAQAQAVSEE